MPFFIVSSQANIRNTFIDQRSPRPPKVGVLRWPPQTNIRTSQLYDSNGLGADSVKTLAGCFLNFNYLNLVFTLKKVTNVVCTLYFARDPTHLVMHY